MRDRTVQCTLEDSCGICGYMYECARKLLIQCTSSRYNSKVCYDMQIRTYLATELAKFVGVICKEDGVETD